MIPFRPTRPPASCHRHRRRFESGPAMLLALAGVVSVALVATMAPGRWAPKATATSVALRVPTAPSLATSVATPEPSVPAKTEAAPRAEMLTGVVARRYRVAQGAAADVVRAALSEGRRHGLDPMLILAVIAVESRFNPIAESSHGAVGLMQVVPRFHMDKIAAVGVPSMLLPEANIAIGTRILKDSIRRGGSDEAGLQLYNGAVDDETRAYANRVLTERRRLEDALPRPRHRA